MGPRISDACHGTLKDMHITLLLILVGPTLQIVQLQYWILWAKNCPHQICAVFIGAPGLLTHPIADINVSPFYREGIVTIGK